MGVKSEFTRKSFSRKFFHQRRNSLLGCPRLPQLRFVNCAFANFPSFFFWRQRSTSSQIAKSDILCPRRACHLPFAVLRICGYLCKNTPPAGDRVPAIQFCGCYYLQCPVRYNCPLLKPGDISLGPRIYVTVDT